MWRRDPDRDRRKAEAKARRAAERADYQRRTDEQRARRLAICKGESAESFMRPFHVTESELPSQFMDYVVFNTSITVERAGASQTESRIVPARLQPPDVLRVPLVDIREGDIVTFDQESLRRVVTSVAPVGAEYVMEIPFSDGCGGLVQSRWVGKPHQVIRWRIEPVRHKTADIADGAPVVQTPDKSPGDVRVFISYAHEPTLPGHRDAVRALANRLRDEGLDARIDQFIENKPPPSWPDWMRQEVDDADFVLCVASPLYKQRFHHEGLADTGRGVRWEGALITEAMYSDAVSANERFIAIVLEGGSADDIPMPLFPASRTHYRLNGDYDRLYRRLTGQPEHLPAPIGSRRLLPPAAPAGVMPPDPSA